MTSNQEMETVAAEPIEENQNPPQPQAPDEKKEYEYYAFISYSHKDKRWAKWLQHKLETYRFPSAIRKENASLPRKIVPIFRDETDLSGGKLWDTLKHRLEESQYLIVVCSPNSAISEYVNEEIKYFKSLKRSDRIIPVIVDGLPNAKSAEEECFAPALRDPEEDEYLGISVREFGKGKAALKLIAQLMRLNYDNLAKRERRRRIKKSVGTSAAIIAGIAAVATVFCLTVLPDKSNVLADQAFQALTSNVDEAAEYAMQGVRYLANPKDSDAAVLQLRNAVAGKEFSDSNPQMHTKYILSFPNTHIVYYGMSPDKKAVVFGDTATFWVHDLQTGKRIATYEHENEAAVKSLLNISSEDSLEYAPLSFFSGFGNGLPEESVNHTVKREEKDGKKALSIYDKNGKLEKTIENAGQYVFNSDESVIVAVIAETKLYAYSFDGRLDREVWIKTDSEDEKIGDIYLSPMGNYLFVMTAKVEEDSTDHEFDNIYDGYQIVDLSEYALVLKVKEKGFNLLSSNRLVFPDKDQNYFFYLSDEKKVYKIEYTDRKPESAPPVNQKKYSLEDIAFSQDGKTAMAYYTSSQYGEFVFFDPETGKEINRFNYSESQMVNADGSNTLGEDVYYTTDANFNLFCVGDENTLSVFDVQGKGDPLFTYAVRGELMEDDLLCNIEISESGSYLLIETFYNLVVFEKNENTYVRITPPVSDLIDDRVFDVCFLHDQLLITAENLSTEEPMTYLFDLKTNKIIHSIPEELDVIRTGENWSNGIICQVTEYSDDGTILCAEYDNDDLSDTIYIYDLQRKKEIPHSFKTENWRFEPTNKLLAYTETYSDYQESNNIRVVEITDGHLKPLYTFEVEDFSVFFFDPSGRYLIVNSNQSSILDAKTGVVLLQSNTRNLFVINDVVYGVPNNRFMQPDALPKTKLIPARKLLPYAEELFQAQ